MKHYFSKPCDILLTPTGVAGKAITYVCLFVCFSARYIKNRCS